MSEQEKAKAEALRQVNLVWEMMQETMGRWSHESLFGNGNVEFGPSPEGDCDAEELHRIFNLESPK